MANRTKGPGKGRFGPGNNANPKGRPKGTPNSTLGGRASEAMKDALLMLLTNPIHEAESKFGKEPTGAQAVALAWVKAAAAGDAKAISSLAERAMGKVPQPVVGGGEDDEPIHFTLDIGQGRK